MAKKIKKSASYKSSTGKKVGIYTGIVSGVLVLTIAGYNIINYVKNIGGEIDTDLPNVTDHITEQVPETPKFTEPEHYEEYDPGETLPELEDTDEILPDLTPEENKEELAEMVNVFAVLTNKTKEYIKEVTNAEPKNLTITSLNSIKIDQANGTVSILGHLKNGQQYHNFITTITNGDSSLKIYTDTNRNSLTSTELSQYLVEVVEHPESHYSTVIKSYNKISNETEVIKAMLNSRIASLKALNSSDQAVTNEINHLNELIKDTSTVKFSLVLNKRNASEAPNIQPFTITLNTSKYTYEMNMDYEMFDNVISNSALTNEIEDYLDENMSKFNVTAQTNTSINNALFLVNSETTVQKSEGLSK